MAPIAIAMALAQFAPSLMRFFNVGDKSVQVAESVVNIASQVTGASSGEEALAILENNADKRYQFKIRIMENDTLLEQMYLDDTKDARKRDSNFTLKGMRNYRADAMFVLAVIVIAWLVWIIWKSPELPEYTKGIFTLVLGRFTGYLDNIYNFEFGTTRGSKNKDDTINKLSEKE